MFETEKLKGRIKEKFGTQKAFAEALGISESTLCRLLMEGLDWKASTMTKAVDLLEIPASQVNDYFFTVRVSKVKQEETS